MTTVEIITIVLSFLALLVSLFTFYKTYRFGDFQLRLAQRTEYSKLLLDLDKELIHDPTLWGVYDSYSEDFPKSNDAKEIGKRDAFIYLHLNLFQSAYCFIHEAKINSSTDKEFWKEWDAYIRDFFDDCSRAHELLNQTDVREIYRPSFIDYISKYLRKISRPEQNIEGSGLNMRQGGER